MYSRLIGILLLGCFVNLSAFDASRSNISFDELFIFNRDKALKELVPGTENYYHYHCLHYQITKNRAKFDESMTAWFKKYGRTQLYKQMLNRQAILDYEANPRKSLDHIINDLRINYNYHKIAEERKIQYPNALDQNLISWENLSKTDIHRISDAGLEQYSKKQLSWQERRTLLGRVKHAGFPNLPQLIVDDLNSKNAGSFGYLKIHRLLTKEQLDECLRLKTDLSNYTQFINTYIQRLRPADHINWEQDKEEKGKYLNTLWDYVSKLKPSFNSLKAHVILQKLQHQRSIGKFDEDLFLEYLKLPRNVYYIRSEYNNRKEFRNVRANLRANYQSVTGFGFVNNFESQLSKDFFEHIFKSADDFKKFEPFVTSTFLDETFAEVKILHGIGDTEKWYARFKNTSYVKELKNRIELRLLPQNTEYVGDEKKVTLNAAVKNIPKLLVKTYKINLFNYYKRYNKQVSTAIDLDGLVAANEKTIVYNQGPEKRHVESFDLDIKENGVYIVELIGNGMSSRALVRKGQFRFTVSQGAVGHVFSIFDENNNQVKDVEIHLAGHVYKAEKEGVILVPYTKSSRYEQIIIKKGNFAGLGNFKHANESYRLNAGFYINREELVKNSSSMLLIRPELLLNGNRIANRLLENVKLTITSRDSKNVSNTAVAEDFKLLETRESFYKINVPEGVRYLSWTLSGEIKNTTTGETKKLSKSSSISLNNSLQTSKIADAYLRQSKDGYYIELLGRTGEPIQQMGVNLQVYHKMVKRPYKVTLKTNDKGEVHLGKLKDIWSISASSNSTNRSWALHEDLNLTATEYNADENELISIPFNWDGSPVTDQVTLIEMRNGQPTYLKTDKVVKKEEYLQLSKLPAGNYRLYLKKKGRVININTLKGKLTGNYILSGDRYIRKANPKSPAISKISQSGEGLTISLKNANPRTRVHIFQSRFNPNNIPGLVLDTVSAENAHVYDFSKLQSQYLSERNIGDEYRYILTRRSGRVFPGNMLDRPGLLLNPWILRKTSTGIANSNQGGEYAKRSAAGRKGSVSRFGGNKAGQGRAQVDSYLDFLKAGQRSYNNLIPDKNGLIKIDKAGLGQTIHVVLVDGYNLQYKKAFIEDEKAPYRNLTLKVILDPEKHFVERKKISVLGRNKDFTLNSISSAKVESYDSLRKVYHLMKTLNPNAHLIEFDFILDWPKLDLAKKLELYSKYACHELNFFIMKKDQQFFKTVVFPYMTNKKGDTFLDHWLKSTPTVKEYTEEWKYSKLNTVERILLAHKNKNVLIKREMQDRFDILKRDRNKLNHLFNSAVQVETLLTGSSLQKGNKADYRDLIMENSATLEKEALSRFYKNSKDSKKRSGRITNEPKAKSEIAPQMAIIMDKLEDAEDEAAFADDYLGGKNADKSLKELEEIRKSIKQYYREVGAVQEWVENNYYKLPIERHVADLIKINAFWRDFAAHTDGPFVSGNIAEATSNFTEMMFALSLLDLPFESGKIDSKLDNGKLVLKPENDLILFHRELEESAAVDNNVVLINQKYFDLQNRHKMEGNEKVEKYISEEFESGKVYGARVIINNPSARNRKVEILTQLPQGAIPVSNSQETMTSLIDLRAYSTQTVEYYFYFPFAGKYKQFPVHISQEGKLLGYEKAFEFNVVDEPTKIDKTTWTWISQNGSNDDVIKYMQNNNMHRFNLQLMAWRLKDANFAKRVLELLHTRNHFHYVSYSFALKHNIRNQAAEFVKFSQFANKCGVYVSAPLLTIDPVERFSYQHREYSPMVNARAYQLGANRKIVNREFLKQYNDFMRYLTYKSEISVEDKLTQVYYLLLQDRVDEGIQLFGKINRDAVNEKVQYDYMKAYVHFYLEEPKKAEVIATVYKEYPVLKWRKKFQQVITQAAEAMGKANIERTTDNRQGMQDHLASKEPVIAFNIDNGQISGEVRNIKQVKVSYYLMDIELLFSRKPFIRQVSSDFAIIEPNMVEMKAVNNNKLIFNIPQQLRNSNVMVEISGEGVSESKVYYANTMKVAVMKNYGILQVVDPNSKPVSKVYVKVYAKKHNGQIAFHKDGYTDLRGKFDYSSINTGDINNVESFSFLVLSDKHGAMIKEAQPPKK